MDILNAILNGQNGATVEQLGSSVGLPADQTSAALSALLPALASGFQRNIQSPDGLASLLGALASGGHSQYLDNPATLGTSAAVDDGNGILGHVFGSKDVSRQVASQAAAQTGISADVLKRLLPLAATVLMGAFAQQRASANAQPTAAGGGVADVLGSLLGGRRGAGSGIDIGSILGTFLGR
jgi:hypothetical protein